MQRCIAFSYLVNHTESPRTHAHTHTHVHIQALIVYSISSRLPCYPPLWQTTLLSLHPTPPFSSPLHFNRSILTFLLLSFLLSQVRMWRRRQAVLPIKAFINACAKCTNQGVGRWYPLFERQRNDVLYLLFLTVLPDFLHTFSYLSTRQ